MTEAEHAYMAIRIDAVTKNFIAHAQSKYDTVRIFECETVEQIADLLNYPVDIVNLLLVAYQCDRESLKCNDFEYALVSLVHLVIDLSDSGYTDTKEQQEQLKADYQLTDDQIRIISAMYGIKDHFHIVHADEDQGNEDAETEQETDDDEY